VLDVTNSQYVQVPVFTTGAAGLTFSCWFQSNGNQEFARLFEFASGGSNDIIAYVMYGGLSISAFDGSRLATYHDNLIANINDDVWCHFTWTLSPDGTWVVYINGEKAWSASNQFYPASMTRTTLLLGASSWQEGSYYNGAIDEFRFYNVTLGEPDVMALYSSYVAPTTLPSSGPTEARSPMALPPEPRPNSTATPSTRGPVSAAKASARPHHHKYISRSPSFGPHRRTKRYDTPTQTRPMQAAV